MKFNAITAAYDRGAKSGTFTWGEFSRLQKNVPNLLENTAKAMGISTEELEKQLKTRKKGETAVKAEDVLKGMQEGLKAELEKAKLAGEADKAAAGSGKALTAQEKKRAEWEERVKTRRQEAVKNAQKAVGKGKGPAEGGWQFGGISDVQIRTGTLGRLGAEMGKAAKSKQDQMVDNLGSAARGMNDLVTQAKKDGGLRVTVNNADDIGARVAPGGPR
jgi:tape measure domain-containing protein